MNVRRTESALADLRAVEAYPSRHPPRYAQGIIDRIFAGSERLEA